MHNRETFKFEVDGELIEVRSVKYTFAAEEIFQNFIGKEKFKKYRETNKLDLDLDLERIKIFYPQLLVGNCIGKIKWEEQEYDELLRVTSFFLNYKKNAELRHMQNESNIMSLIIGQAKEAMDSIRNFGLKNPY